MTQTENLGLNLFAGDDAVDVTKINENTQKVDTSLAAAARFAVGAYTGDGQSKKTISLGITPKAVFVFCRGNSVGDSYPTGGLAVTGHNASGVVIADGGFQVIYDTSGKVYTNMANIEYYYLALY